MKPQWLQTQVPIQRSNWKGVGWRWPLQTRKPFKPSKRTKPNKAMPKEANLQKPGAAIPWQAPAPVVNTPRGAPKSLQSPLSCFHADRVAARCAEEHSKLSAGLPKLFNLSKNSEIRPHLTDSTAPALLGQMGTTGCFGSQVQLQTNGTLWPLVYTKIRLLSIYLNMHSLHWMKLKKGNRHFQKSCTSTFQSSHLSEDYESETSKETLILNEKKHKVLDILKHWGRYTYF